MRNWIFLLLLASTLTATAQKRKLTMTEAVLGLSSNLAVKNMKQLKWSGSKYAYVVSNENENVIMQVDPLSFESEVAISLEKMNKDLAKLGLKALKSFPLIEWLDDQRFYITHENKWIQFVVSPSESMRTDIIGQFEEGTEHMHLHMASKQVAYVKEFQLYVGKMDESAKKITNDGQANILYGTSVHRDEFGISEGLFWSPKGNALAFYRMDQSMVEDYPVVDWSTTPAQSKNIKYPFSGRTSHQVTLGVYHPATQQTIYLNTSGPKDQYLTTVTWSPDEKYIYLSILNRDQNHLTLNCYDAKNGELIRTLFEEKHDKYVEPQHALYFLKNQTDQFIWWSQRDGFMHLYLYKTDGRLIRQITKGEWLVNEIIGEHEAGNEILFTATKESPLQKNVYAVNVQTGVIRSLSSVKGSHQAMARPDGKYLIDVYQNASMPRNIEIVNTQTKSEKRIFTANNPLDSVQLAAVTNLELLAQDGTKLFAKLMLPAEFDATKKYPVIVYLYNGPHVQLIKDGFPASGNLWYDLLTQKGYIVFVMDGRGSSNRGHQFESAIHRQLGTLEMQDQLQGVNYLKSLPYVDPQRMGVHGWSYGGFMTTSLMLRHPGVFQVGVAGGPVLDWSMYEVMYTERYMDNPEQNPEGYKANVLFDKVKNLKSKLLMIHGTDDDVVVWQHSLRFVKRCVEEGVPLDYFVYPGHPHNVRGKDRVHLMQKITDYMDAVLKP